MVLTGWNQYTTVHNWLAAVVVDSWW
jgi:hypothetical protein